MAEINLLKSLPKVKRDLTKRLENKTQEDIDIAKQFGKDFFDGERRYGYGGYKYDGRWRPVARDLIEYYNLNESSRVLDVGCAKGFLMYDLKEALPGITVRGLEVSQYAKENAYNEMSGLIDIGSAEWLPYDDNSFELVISVNTIHNLTLDKCKNSLKELERVSSKSKFISVDAWNTDEEKQAVINWVLTAETYMSVNDWVNLFEDVGYTGDYWWFIP